MKRRLKKIGVLLFSIFYLCTMAGMAFAAPAQTPERRQPGDLGYAALSKYAQKVAGEKDVYKITLLVDMKMRRRNANVIILLNQNGCMTYPTSMVGKNYYDLAADSINALLDLFYTDEEVKDNINIAIYNHALRYDTTNASDPSTAVVPLYNPASVWWPTPVNTAMNSIVRDRTVGLRFASESSLPPGFIGVSHHNSSSNSFQNLLYPTSTSDLRGCLDTNLAPQFAFAKAYQTFSSLPAQFSDDLNYVIYMSDGWIQEGAAFTQAEVSFPGTAWPSASASDVGLISGLSNVDFDYDHLLIENTPGGAASLPYFWWADDEVIVPINDLSAGGTHQIFTTGIYSPKSWVSDAAGRKGVDPISMHSALYETKRLKQAGSKIYTIAWYDSNTTPTFFDPRSSANLSYNFMVQASSNNSVFLADVMKPSILTDLQAEFVGVGNDVRSALQEGASVHDSLSEYVEFFNNGDQAALSCNVGEARFEKSEIVWDIPAKVFFEGKQASLSYYVRLRDGLNNENWYPTNEYAYIDYLDASDKSRIVKYFPVPYVKRDENESRSDANSVQPADSIGIQDAGRITIDRFETAYPRYTASVTATPALSKLDVQTVDAATGAKDIVPETGNRGEFAVKIILVSLACVGIVFCFLKKRRSKR